MEQHLTLDIGLVVLVGQMYHSLSAEILIMYMILKLNFIARAE